MNPTGIAHFPTERRFATRWEVMSAMNSCGTRLSLPHALLEAREIGQDTPVVWVALAGSRLDARGGIAEKVACLFGSSFHRKDPAEAQPRAPLLAVCRSQLR